MDDKVFDRLERQSRRDLGEAGQAECRKCGLPITFEKMANGKWKPTNLDGSDHWDICKATRRKAEGFKPERDIKSAGWITGANYRPTGETSVPWD